MMKSGVEGKQTVFLFTDDQIKEESFVEDINMILNTGDVPNIFANDEKADIIEKMQGIARLEVSFSRAFVLLFCYIRKRGQAIYCFLCARE